MWAKFKFVLLGLGVAFLFVVTALLILVFDFSRGYGLKSVCDPKDNAAEIYYKIEKIGIPELTKIEERLLREVYKGQTVGP